MGHGASTNVRRISSARQRVPAQEEDGNDDEDPRIPVWTRSNSDGCIVENLNTSKTKVDLLEQQVGEFKELFRLAEEKYEEANERAKTLEKQLAEVEGANFELTDRVSDLEQQLESFQVNSGSEVNIQLEQELTLSCQQVEKLEMHVKLLEEQMTTMRSKFRKKVRAANTEVTEAKQESSLKLYRLKEEIKQLENENLKLTQRLEHSKEEPAAQSGAPSRTHSEADQPAGEDSRLMVILELSSQVSNQEERIQEVTTLLEQKEKMVADLNDQLAQLRPPSQMSTGRPPSGLTTNRPLSGRSTSHGAFEPGGSGSGQQRASGRSARSTRNDNGRTPTAQKSNDSWGSGDETALSEDVDADRSGREENRVRSGRKSSSAGREGRADKDGGSMSAGRRRSSSREGKRSSSSSSSRRRREKDVTDGEDDRSSRTAENLASEADTSRSSSGNLTERLTQDPCNAVDTSCNHSNSNKTTVSIHSRGSKRASSAGSEDSAFHENGEEGTKSAPSSAGSSRLRRRLKSSQQRAVSLDTLDSTDSKSPKPPARTNTNLYERDSGVDDSCATQASKQLSKSSHQDLDDLLQEIMNESPADGDRRDNKATSSHTFGISEDKIRSLLSDSAS